MSTVVEKQQEMMDNILQQQKGFMDNIIKQQNEMMERQNKSIGGYFQHFPDVLRASLLSTKYITLVQKV